MSSGLGPPLREGQARARRGWGLLDRGGDRVADQRAAKVFGSSVFLLNSARGNMRAVLIFAVADNHEVVARYRRRESELLHGRLNVSDLLADVRRCHAQTIAQPLAPCK